MTRRMVGAAVLVVALIALVVWGVRAFADAEAAPSQPPTSAPVVAPVPASVTPHAELVAFVRAEYPDVFSVVSDAELTDIALDVCDALDAGATHAAVIDSIVAGSTTVRSAGGFGYLAGAAVRFLCPAHLPEFDTGTPA